MLVKMLGREAAITVAIKPLHLRFPINRNPLARGLVQPPVQQTRLALLLVALAPTPERPLGLPPKARLLPTG
jgi:hypothetical protein